MMPQRADTSGESVTATVPKLLDVGQLAVMWNVSRRTALDRVLLPGFPKPVLVGPNAYDRRWRADDYNAWVARGGHFPGRKRS